MNKIWTQISSGITFSVGLTNTIDLMRTSKNKISTTNDILDVIGNMLISGICFPITVPTFFKELYSAPELYTVENPYNYVLFKYFCVTTFRKTYNLRAEIVPSTDEFKRIWML